jgi:hypothetical protein
VANSFGVAAAGLIGRLRLRNGNGEAEDIKSTLIRSQCQFGAKTVPSLLICTQFFTGSETAARCGFDPSSVGLRAFALVPVGSSGYGFPLAAPFLGQWAVKGRHVLENQES